MTTMVGLVRVIIDVVTIIPTYSLFTTIPPSPMVVLIRVRRVVRGCGLGRGSMVCLYYRRGTFLELDGRFGGWDYGGMGVYLVDARAARSVTRGVRIIPE